MVRWYAYGDSNDILHKLFFKKGSIIPLKHLNCQYKNETNTEIPVAYPVYDKNYLVPSTGTGEIYYEHKKTGQKLSSILHLPKKEQAMFKFVNNAHRPIWIPKKYQVKIIKEGDEVLFIVNTDEKSKRYKKVASDWRRH